MSDFNSHWRDQRKGEFPSSLHDRRFISGLETLQWQIHEEDLAMQGFESTKDGWERTPASVHQANVKIDKALRGYDGPAPSYDGNPFAKQYAHESYYPKGV